MIKLTCRVLGAVAFYFACFASVMLSGPALAQVAWPNKPITLIVPFSPGGSNDVFARALAKELTVTLKHLVVVENRAGAGGLLGTGLLAKAPPDGYTLMLASSSITVGAALKTGLPFDMGKDLQPIAMVASGPLLLVSSPNFPAKTPSELVAMAKSQPGKLTYASSGLGSTPQMGMELLSAAANLQLLHVPYKGGGQVMADLMGGTVDLYMGSVSTSRALVQNGKIKAIGVTSRQRSAQLPETPTINEAVPGFSFEVWWGVFGPAGMPKELTARLNQEINKVLQTPSLRQYIDSEGVAPGSGSAEQFNLIVQKELQNWRDVGKRSNIKVE
jgi:tripartite-type tricarboxylate transporter receptor subunit TctC